MISKIKWRIWYFFNLIFFRDNHILKKCPDCRYFFIASMQSCCSACGKYRMNNSNCQFSDFNDFQPECAFQLHTVHVDSCAGDSVR